MIARTLPAEFRLASACCIWPPSERRNAAIRDAAAQPIDWTQLRAVAERHRIVGLVYDGLKRAVLDVPPETMTALGARAAKIARDSLALAGEAVRLQGTLDAAGVPSLLLKGTPLALLAYGDIGIKHAWDIDILVADDSTARACTALESAGYDRTYPDASMPDNRFRVFTGFAHEAAFRHRAQGTVVELHWRLTDNTTLAVDLAKDVREAALNTDRRLRTLSDEPNFAYLCLHGAHHAWARMKWLADLAAWLTPKTPGEIEHLVAYAKAHGAGRAAAQALLLCEELFGFPLAPELAHALRATPAVKRLIEIAYDVMQVPEGLHLSNAKVKLSAYLLTGDPRDWARQLNQQMVGWTDFMAFPLPRSLYFLYPIIRVPSWLWRRGVQRLRRA